MALWLGFAIIGGLADGQLLTGYSVTGAHTGDAADMQAAGQPEIVTEQSGVLGFFSNLVTWFAATADFLKGWANMLALNFSFFSGGGLEVMVGWIFRAIIGIPMITMIAMQIFGR